MVIKSGKSPTPRSPSQIELSANFSHHEVDQLSSSSSEDLDQDTALSSNQNQESETLIDVAPSEFEHQQPAFSFRELAKFFGPGLLTCVAYVVSSVFADRDVQLVSVLKSSLHVLYPTCRIPEIWRLICKLVDLLGMPCYGFSLSAPSW